MIGWAIGFWGSLIVASALALPILKLLAMLKSRQTVSAFVPEHAKKQGTPTMGGLIILAGAITGIVGLGIYRFPQAWSYLLLLLGFGAIGFVDDYVVPKLMKGKRGLGWKQKLAMQIVLAGVVLYLEGIKAPGSIALGVFLILFFSNAYNFADGLDALAGSIGVFLFLGLAAIGCIEGQTFVPAICLCLVGGFVPFLMLNAPPAKVFMGDVGALPIGATIGLLYMDSMSKVTDMPALWLGLAVLSIMMMAELIPVPLQVASVKLTGKRIFLKTPIHHGFETRGWPETRIVWRFAMVQLICSALAVTIVGIWS